MPADLAQFKRLFPFSLEARTCEECGGDMTEEWVRDPLTQSHWRGVEAWQCEDCDRTERKHPDD